MLISGTTISVSQNGMELLSNVYGYKDVNKNKKIDKETIFSIGSITKAFTAMAVGILVDEGKIEWDKAIINYIPEFRMFDEFATKRITMIDLLSHRTGLAPHNNFWYGSKLTRSNIFLSAIPKFTESKIANSRKIKKKFEQNRHQNAITTESLEAFAGKYFHLGYGEIDLYLENNQLIADD